MNEKLEEVLKTLKENGTLRKDYGDIINGFIEDVADLFDEACDRMFTLDTSEEPPTPEDPWSFTGPPSAVRIAYLQNEQVRDWPVKMQLRAQRDGRRLILDISGDVPQAVDNRVTKVPVALNLWFALKRGDGTWGATTCEWLRGGGRRIKGMECISGEFAKNSQISRDWTPDNGEQIKVMVSGLCRYGTRNVEVRSNWSTIQC